MPHQILINIEKDNQRVRSKVSIWHLNLGMKISCK